MTRYGPYVASQPCAGGGTFHGHGTTSEAALANLRSFVTGRTKYAGHPEGTPSVRGPVDPNTGEDRTAPPPERYQRAGTQD